MTDALSLAAKGRGGPPVLALHGFAQLPQSFLPFFAALPDHGPVHAPCLPGHGGAPTGAQDFQGAARAIAALVPADGVLLGYSLGGRLALGATLLAGATPRVTIALSAHPGLESEAERATRRADDEGRARALEEGPLERFLDSWEALPLFSTQAALPAELLRAQRAARAAHRGPDLAWAFRAASLAGMPALGPALRTTTRPVRLLTGALDERYGALARPLHRPPTVRHDLVPGAGHNLLLEAPEALARHLQETLRWPT